MAKKTATVAADKTLCVSAKEAREAIALLVPHLARKRKWSNDDCGVARAIFGYRGVSVRYWVSGGVHEAWAMHFLIRLRAVFAAIVKWNSQDAAREFLLTPNSRLDGRRPLDLLRVSEDISGKDSFHEVLEVFAAARAYSGHPMMMVRDDELVCV